MKKLLWFASILVILSSCSNYKKVQKDYLLFKRGLDSMPNTAYKPLRIEARDNLEIQVYTESSTSNDQVNIFNTSEGRGGTVSVDERGFVDVPRLGRVKAIGLTCKEFADTLTERLKIFVKRPGVFVKMGRFQVNVMGEVKNPGIKVFTDERATLTEVISLSGGFADEATRNDVLIIREDSGQRKSYVVDFQNADSLFSSPVYQLKQNDLVFVRPSDAKYRAIYNQSVQQKVQPITNYSSVISLALNFILISIAIFRK